MRKRATPCASVFHIYMFHHLYIIFRFQVGCYDTLYVLEFSAQFAQVSVHLVEFLFVKLPVHLNDPQGIEDPRMGRLAGGIAVRICSNCQEDNSDQRNVRTTILTHGNETTPLWSHDRSQLHHSVPEAWFGLKGAKVSDPAPIGITNHSIELDLSSA